MKFLDNIKKNQSLMRFIETTQSHMVTAEIGNSSVVVAYYLLLSLFPLLIAVGNVLPYLRIDPNSVLPYIAEAIPKDVYKNLEPAIRSLLTQRSGGLLSVSALAAFWSASQSINAMNKAFGVEQRKNFILVRVVSFLVILLFMVAIVGVVVILGLGQYIIELLQPIFHYSTSVIDTFQALKWPLTTVVLLVIMCLIYAVVPNRKLSLRSILPGAIFSTVGWMLLSQIFGLYVKYFSSRIASYQIIGSFIILMLWLNFAATIIILGAIVNAVVDEYLSGDKEKKQPSFEQRLFRWFKKKNK